MIDLITVVFRDEIPLLRIQAESINRYINPKDINCITIVVNDTDDVVNLIDTSWYHHKNIQIIPYSRWHYTSRINGWENQQLCKLLAASESTVEWSIVLDAKTWFVRDFVINDLFDEIGRPCVGLAGVSPYFESSQKFVEQHFNILMPAILGPAGVPFVFHTNTASELINDFENFIEFFQTNVRYPNLITEFHLYTGKLLKKFNSLETLYNIKTQYYYPCNMATWETNNFEEIFNSMQLSRTSTVSIHRDAYKNLSNDQIQRWSNFLVSKHLLQSPEQLKLN